MDLESIIRNSNVELFKLQELFLQISNDIFLEGFSDISKTLTQFFEKKGFVPVPTGVLVAHLKSNYDQYYTEAFIISLNSAMTKYKNNRDVIVEGKENDEEKASMLNYEVSTVVRKYGVFEAGRDVSAYDSLGGNSQTKDVPDYDKLIKLSTEEIVYQLEQMNAPITNPALRDLVETEVNETIKSKISESAIITIDYMTRQTEDCLNGLNKQIMDSIKLSQQPQQVSQENTLDSSMVFGVINSKLPTTDIFEGEKRIPTEGVFMDRPQTTTGGIVQSLPTDNIFSIPSNEIKGVLDTKDIFGYTTPEQIEETDINNLENIDTIEENGKGAR